MTQRLKEFLSSNLKIKGYFSCLLEKIIIGFLILTALYFFARPHTGAEIFFFCSLWVIGGIVCFIDCWFFLIPDMCTFFIGILGYGYTFPTTDPKGWVLRVLGGGILGIILRYFPLRKGGQKFWSLPPSPALGGGDIKLLMGCSSWLIIEQWPQFYVMTGIFGLLLGEFYKETWGLRKFPLGPALIFSLIINILI